MVTGQGGVPVEPARPSVPRTGLIVSALNQPQGEDARWLNGFSFQALDCLGGGILDPCATGVELVIPDNPDQIDFQPFGVWAGYKCSPWDREFDWARAVTDALLATESYQIAHELWRGDLARDSAWPNAYLADSDNSFDLSEFTAPVTPLEALACLEDYIAQCSKNQQGFIHATRGLVIQWANGGALRREGQRTYTVHDTVVVSDGGFDGSGPTGRDEPAPEAAGATQWAYATGPVTVRLEPLAERSFPDPDGGADLIQFVSPVIGGPTAEGMNLQTNTVEVRAQRLAAATWSGCCHAHVEVDFAACGVAGS
jgi:hypothetical protein